ncbi:MAG: DNA-processing protein DprA [Candidatus Peribacteraceae bacterium]|jgi:DNA processing protein
MAPSPSSLLWSSLNVLTKERYDALLQVYGSLDDATKHLGEELLRGLGCREETVREALTLTEDFDAERYASALEEKGIRFFTLAENEYPARLLQVEDPPPFLYAKGDLTLLEQPCIGLVGTRAMSRYGRRVVGHFVPDFVAAGVVTVSGLAEGIDAEVARETIRCGGRTVAVLGHGLGMVYPRGNRGLADEIVEAGGLLLSEFPLFKNPEKYTFVARNRIIAGLSLATVVLEAPEGSGALITADLALGYGRDVFAVPGEVFDPNYAGCHALLKRRQAMLADHPSAVLRELGMVAPAQRESAFTPQGKDEAAVYAVLTGMPQDIDQLTERLKMEAGRINAALTMMELSGGAKNAGGGMWVRS